MPNWVSNRLRVEAPTEVMTAVRGLLLASPQQLADFRDIIPVPLDADAAACSRAWGTKWQPESVAIVDECDDSVLRLDFQSANGPPLPIVAGVARRVPGAVLHLQWLNPNVGEAGEAEFSHGSAVIDTATDRDDPLYAEMERLFA